VEVSYVNFPFFASLFAPVDSLHELPA